MNEYKKYSNLDNYVFEDLTEKFQREHELSVFDFFCIVIWKANRAKSRVANRIKEKEKDLKKAIYDITHSLYNAADDKQRLQILIEGWKLRLPMSSAILSVLYPDRFTVYDYRVCEQLSRFKELGNKTSFESIWDGYNQYLDSVKEFVPSEKQLREKDKYLWGKSFYEDLEKDIESGFPKRSNTNEYD